MEISKLTEITVGNEIRTIRVSEAKLLDPNADIQYALEPEKYNKYGTIVFGRNPNIDNKDTFESPETYNVKVIGENGQVLRHTECHRREFALTVNKEKFGNKGLFLTNLDEDVMFLGSGKNRLELSAGSGMVVDTDKYSAGFWVAMGRTFKIKFNMQTSVDSATSPVIAFKPMRVGLV